MVMSWSITLLYLSLAPAPPQLEGPLGWDKLQHSAALGVLAFLVSMTCIALSQPLKRSIAIGFIYSTLFGGLIEILQGVFTTYRQAEPLDFAADTVGASIVAMTLFFSLRYRGMR